MQGKKVLMALASCVVIAGLAGHVLAGSLKAQPAPQFPDAPAWLSDQVVYQVNLRHFSERGDVAGFREHLPRLKALGVGTLWFMPIHPIGVSARIGSVGSPYAVREYLQFNPDYGRVDEFRELVEEIHRMGMRVIIDWVAPHTAVDHVWVAQHPTWYRRDAQGRLVPPRPEWTDVAALDYGVPEMRAAMLGAMKFWVKDVGVDGFRCDSAEFVPLDFWVTVRDSLRNIKPVLMLAEGASPQLMEYAFDSVYAWHLSENTEGIVRGTKTVADLANYFAAEQQLVPQGGNRLNYTSNHDKNAFEGTTQELLGAAAPACAVLTFTIPGIPMIFNGQENGLEHRLNLFERDSIQWQRHEMSELYTRLARLKSRHPSLRSGDKLAPMNISVLPGAHSVLFYRRKCDRDEIAVAINFSPQASTFRPPADVASWTVALGGAPRGPSAGEVTLQGWTYVVWSK